FEKADSLQKELEIILQNADNLRNRYGTETNRQKKKLIGESILSLESQSLPMKNEITQLLITAQNAEDEYWQQAPKSELKNFMAQTKSIEKTAQFDNSERVDKSVSGDTVPLVDPLILWDAQRPEPAETGNPETDELIYKIQIGAYSHGLPSYVKRLFKKLSLIRKIENYTDEKGVVVYTTGNLLNLEDAIKMKNQVRQEGVEDAYVVPYFKGKRITLAQAKKIEEEK
ncbi:MAG: hypothetical protein J7L95_07565, partial [Prolixibacteraceae bacterium]|nr:hypothetical protein [Prolixibacteraceae bacterium]